MSKFVLLQCFEFQKIPINTHNNYLTWIKQIQSVIFQNMLAIMKYYKWLFYFIINPILYHYTVRHLNEKCFAYWTKCVYVLFVYYTRYCLTIFNSIDFLFFFFLIYLKLINTNCLDCYLRANNLYKETRTRTREIGYYILNGKRRLGRKDGFNVESNIFIDFF